MAKKSKGTSVKEFYAHASTAADNNAIGFAMEACGMPGDEFFYHSLDGTQNIWRCTRTQAIIFARSMPGVIIFSRTVGANGATGLKAVTNKLS